MMPGEYNVTLAEAVGASASAPLYFNPETNTNKFNITDELVDGGVICNNPSFYAYELASELKGKKNIRMVSLGTGA